MVWRLLKNYGAGRADEALQEFASAVLAFDPDVASEAETVMMQAELTKLSGRLVQAEAEVAREHRETMELQSTYERFLEAAGELQREIDRTNNVTTRIERETSLSRLIEYLERLKPEIVRELQESHDVEVWVGSLRTAFDDLVSRLHRKKDHVRSVRQSVRLAKNGRALASKSGSRASSMAGLTMALAAISVALDVMNKETARMLTESDALELKAMMLLGDRLEHDPHIAAALHTVSPSLSASRQSLRERLARLETGSPMSPASAA